MIKKVFIAASLIAFMSAAAFAQEPATQAKTAQQTQVAHKHHAKTGKKTSLKKHHAVKGKKADSSSTQTN